MATAYTDTDGVNQALASLLAWPDLARSPQLANFLAYIVERRLTGDAQSIKAYSIAVDVFGRSPDFDPQADPIVRVQARRLRALLDQYYVGPGVDDPLRIQLPIGRYVPDFVDSATEPSAKPIGREPSAPVGVSLQARRRGHVTISWFVLLVLAIGAAALTYSLATLGPRQAQVEVAAGALQMPKMRVMEFQNLTGDDGLTAPVSSLAVELVTVAAQLVVVEATLGGRDVVEALVGADEDFVLTGIVRSDASAEGGYQFNAILTDLHTNSVVWNWTDKVSREEVTGRAGIYKISEELIVRLGGHRGPLHARAREYLTHADIRGQENFYLCGILFGMYRTDPSLGASTRASSCIDALPDQGVNQGSRLAARASLLAESVNEGRISEAERTARFAEAEQLMAEALQLSPTSGMVWDQRARLYETRGMHEEAQTAYRTALQRTSANIDATAGHARHLALIGRLDEAVPLAQYAIDVTPALSVPDWFYCVSAMAALRNNTFQRAKRLAEDCGRVDKELGAILSLLIAQGAGDAAMVGQVLPRILEVPTFRSFGIMTRMRYRMTDQALLGQIEVALLKAGVPEKSLDGPY